MSYAERLKARINGLPGKQFVAAWKVIEAARAAADEAGTAGFLDLAVSYVKARRWRGMCRRLQDQDKRIDSMATTITALAAERDGARLAAAKLEKRLARLKPKKKSKRKA